MDRHKDSFRTPVSRLEIIDTRRRRRFTAEAKFKILEEGFSGDGRQVSATAEKHGVSRSQLYRWRQLAQSGSLCRNRIEGFVPAVITPDVPAPVSAASASVVGSGRMEVLSTNGRRVIVDREVDVDALLRILRALETLR
ncbi:MULTISPECIES: IS66-like element accessory protein TnpA [unclassified Shinella]|uniref:IS66-like element accessory protein TnpA n=1 Tax=unclassified Shinella TaxID=2643062 RepID=UPI00225D0290|nr:MULTISPECIES: transposase [unclassified Shinella]CAI0334094.1 transposase [Rhizobiaceae bacterium]CAK7261747.1 transposase [Shinella sp. WSC3-e]MDC7259676.1 transposase [Shinella sp. YE25]MDC7266852.1 transposase [Shinella sp. HY16]MDC7273749.1 transposase [Shinella sp. YZ44]